MSISFYGTCDIVSNKKMKTLKWNLKTFQKVGRNIFEP